MKLSQPSSVAARGLLLMVIAAVLCGPARLHAQINAAGLQEQGDEMSRQVGGFFRKLFYGEDRNESGYRPQQPQQPAYRTAPPPQPRQYQTAPPPVSRRSDDYSTPQRPRSNPNPPPATASRKSSTHASESDKPKRKDTPPATTASRSIAKHTEPEEKPRKKTEEPSSKQVVKHKDYTPPRLNEDADAKPAPSKSPALKAPTQPENSSKVASKKSTPDTDGISPYAEDHRPGGGTLLAPKDSIASTPPAKTEEKKKETKPSTPADGTFPTGTASKANPGSVVSPYPPFNELDVGGLPSGSLAVDPTTKKVFRVP